MKITDKRTYVERRRVRYMAIEDQMDAAMKGLEAVRQARIVDLPEATLEWLDHCKAVKARIPKERDAKS